MQKTVGFVVMIAGFVLVIVGIISGQSGVHVPSNILGPYNTFTAVSVYGGAVAAFVGFAVMMVAGTGKSL